MTDASLSALYQEMILDHYRRPRNRGALEGADATIPMRNPLCGDELTLELVMDGERVSDIRFTGHGCSISQASASMMTELVKGKSAGEIEQLRERFRAMVMGDADAAGDATLGKVRALSGVARFPARVKCALLGWNALEQGLDRAIEAARAREAAAGTTEHRTET
jgi:nitrogen fixation NifU-like protein